MTALIITIILLVTALVSVSVTLIMFALNGNFDKFAQPIPMSGKNSHQGTTFLNSAPNSIHLD